MRWELRPLVWLWFDVYVHGNLNPTQILRSSLCYKDISSREKDSFCLSKQSRNAAAQTPSCCQQAQAPGASQGFAKACLLASGAEH